MTTRGSLFQSNRIKLFFSILLVALFAAPMMVDAARVICRSDPIVFLSDGTRLQFDTLLETSVDDVDRIEYRLHVPVGVEIDRIVFTPKWARDKETVELIADQPAGHYVIVTTAYTGTPNVAAEVSAKMVARANGGEGSTHTSASGVSGQPITINLQRN